MMQRHRAVRAAAARLAVLVLALVAVPCGAQDDTTNPYAGDAAAAHEGQELFTRSGCIPCHGPNGEGALGPSLIDDEWIFRFSPDMVYRTIRTGRRGTRMVGFGERLTPDETWKIVEFLLARGREVKAGQGK